MKGLFDIEGKFFHYATKFAELMWLNILTLVCCFPLLTVGTAFTAMHKVLLQIYRDEESKITKTYFSAFRSNFLQSTIIWLFYILLFGILIADYYLVQKVDIAILQYAQYIFLLLALIEVLSLVWVFALQSRYHNPVKRTIKYAFISCIAYPFKSIVMVFLLCVPVILLFLAPAMVPTIILLGISLTGLLRTIIYDRVFKIMENDLEKNDSSHDNERIEENETL